MSAKPTGIATARMRGALWAATFIVSSTVGCARNDRAPHAADSTVASLDTATNDTSSAPVLRVERDSTAGPGAVPVSGIPSGTSRGTASGTAPSDTARGILHTVGAAPLTHVVLVRANGETLALASSDSVVMMSLAAADGLEIMILGARTAERVMDMAPTGTRLFQVRQFAVRAVDGVSARDGVLRRSRGSWYLETSPGAHEPIVDLPVALRSQEGARVFLAGDPTHAPQSFGVLRAPSRAAGAR